MSSDRPGDAPSAPPERPARARPELDLAGLLRLRGGPLIDALDDHLPGARDHAEATASYAFAGAVGLGFDRAHSEVAREVAVLHEVGLVYVDAELAAKPAADRSAAEQDAWDDHYESGYRLARGAGIPEHVCGWLLRARERYDGSGPEQMIGDAIPIESRLIRAACACQTALTAAEARGGQPVGRGRGTRRARGGGSRPPRGRGPDDDPRARRRRLRFRSGADSGSGPDVGAAGRGDDGRCLHV